MMMTKQLALLTAALAAGVCLAATPALAGIAVPAPEDGAGLAALSLVGTGYLYLKRRLSRR
jgi:hypothetical protein